MSFHSPPSPIIVNLPSPKIAQEEEESLQYVVFEDPKKNSHNNKMKKKRGDVTSVGPSDSVPYVPLVLSLVGRNTRLHNLGTHLCQSKQYDSIHSLYNISVQIFLQKSLTRFCLEGFLLSFQGARVAARVVKLP